VIVESPCPACGGSGRDDRGRRIEVKIPAGVADGAKIRLRAEGEMGENGGPPGDLLLTVRVAPHPSFQRDGIDIESEVEIDMVEAALGVTRDIQTLAGKVDLRIPPGVQPGARLRLKGRGVRDHRGRTGDHFVRVRVRIPRKLTERQIALLTEFRNPEGSEEKKEETGDDHEPRN
jgi:molecular chaperone DnaJ